jgi:hypothetical protein
MCNAVVYGLNPVVQKAWKDAHPAAYALLASAACPSSGHVQNMQPVGGEEVEVVLQREEDVGFDGQVSSR